jgi:hypothetical protein
MTTAHDIDWDGVMDVAADFAEKSWLLARRPSRRRFSTPAYLLLVGGVTMYVERDDVRRGVCAGVVMTEDWESVRYV